MQLLQAGLGDRIVRYVNDSLIPQAIDFATDAVTFLIVLVVVYYVGKAVVRPTVQRLLDARGVEETLAKPAQKLTLVGVAFVALAVAFAVAGFGNLLTSIATIAAALTLAIGFASQALLGNLVSGAFLIADREIKIGDWVEWNGNVGVIEDISFRVSRVRTFDNELITVPNSELANTAITNPVAKDKLRIQFLFGVGYDDDLDHAKEVIIDEAGRHDEILDDPPATVRLTELADSYVGLKSRVWIDEPDRSDFVRVRSEYVQAVKERCDAEEIEMPYPYQQLTGTVTVADAEPTG
ncbi:mechanosensitive ion channel family protein [Halosegnis sp.]|uniref:mechanosensitive ion channel family protein n=1 Tax=Halosegnis sp. TaxID=2864959 RepID=UPI0035D52924